MDIRELLEFMVRQNISDIHFKAHCAPLIRLNGSLISTKQDPFSPELIKTLAYTLMDERLKTTFEAEGELDMAYALDGVGRFRVNIYRQKGTIALSLRVIPLELKSFEQLHLPAPTLEKLCAAPSGLILMAGVTGAGKTTTLNAMVHYLNEHYAYNIITIEDPIEFYHLDKKSSVSQREVGQDTQSFSTARKHILRQDPDVIVIGEMRDPEAIAAAVTAAETGHLGAVDHPYRGRDANHSTHRRQLRAGTAATHPIHLGERAARRDRAKARDDGEGRRPAALFGNYGGEFLYPPAYQRRKNFRDKHRHGARPQRRHGHV